MIGFFRYTYDHSALFALSRYITAFHQLHSELNYRSDTTALYHSAWKRVVLRLGHIIGYKLIVLGKAPMTKIPSTVPG